MLVVIVIVFALCWLPLHLFNFTIDVAPYLLDQINSKDEEKLYLGLYYACHWLAMAHSCANPLIYSFLNDRFIVSCYIIIV